MKKIILSVFSLALLFSTFSTVIASTTLDNVSGCKCMGGDGGGDDGGGDADGDGAEEEEE